MTDKQAMQANGKSDAKQIRSDGVSDTDTHGKTGGGESNGGSYPNPHRGKKPASRPETFIGHGGQSEMGYHGSGQLGDQQVGDEENPNAPTK